MDNFDIDQVQPVFVEGIITALLCKLSGVCIHCIVGLVDQCQLMFEFNSKGVHSRPLNQSGQPWVPPHQTLMKFGRHYEHKSPFQEGSQQVFRCSLHNCSLTLLTVKTKSVACMLYPMSTKTFNWLVSNPKPFDPIMDCDVPMRMDLIFNPEASSKFGAFKKAIGTLTVDA